jgi:uncharacterized membrane-anchored protein
MRVITALMAGLLCAFAAAPLSADQGVYPKTEEELRAAYAALKWQDAPGSYKLPGSHAAIRLQSGQTLLLGADAERYSWLDSGGVEFPGTEAILASESDTKLLVYYEWRDAGYVSDTDWSDVDGDVLLRQYRDATESRNDERIGNGLEPMHVVGWLEPPHYDKRTHTITYAMELNDKKGHWANAVALRLGRAGYAELTWVGSIDSFQSASGRPELLDQALAAHAFEDGYRYEDFNDGDKVAAYGLAGVVATVLGLKFGKGLLLPLLAKIGLPAAALAAYIGWEFRQLLASWRWRRRRS